MALQYVSQTDPAVADAMRQELARERDPWSSSPRRTSRRPPSWKPWAACSRTSTPRAIPASATTAAARRSTWWRTLPATAPASCTARSTPRAAPFRCSANFGAYLSIIEPGDTVLGMSLDHGGHLTHGSPVNFSGLLYNIVSYGVNPRDRDHRLRRARAHREGVPPEGHRRRRLGLPALHRLRAHGGNRP